MVFILKSLPAKLQKAIQIKLGNAQKVVAEDAFLNLSSEFCLNEC